MPRGDGTGPLGQGPMTGRAAGYCAGYDRPGYVNAGRAFGRGGGFGWGRGARNRFRAPGLPFGLDPMAGEQAPPEPLSALEFEKAAIERQLEALDGRLSLLKERIAMLSGVEGKE